MLDISFNNRVGKKHIILFFGMIVNSKYFKILLGKLFYLLNLKISYMKKKLFILLPFFILLSIGYPYSQDKNELSTEKTLAQRFTESYSECLKSLQAKDYQKYVENSKKLLSFAPNHPDFRYRYAQSLALKGNYEESLKWLNKVLDIEGLVIKGLTKDSIFKPLYSNEQFIRLVESINKKFSPVNTSEIAYTIGEKDLIPEGTAYDTKDKVLYISSTHKRKIISIDKNGQIRDFTKETQDGLLSVLGMEVDEKRRHLWVCTGFNASHHILDRDKNTPRETFVAKYSLDSGKLLEKYSLTDDGVHFFNDLTILSNGDVYITDTSSGAVYKISNKSQKLEMFIDPSQFIYSNGITVSDDEKDLFVAHYAGISKINIKTKRVTELMCKNDITLAYVDGLAFYKNTLIAHQGSMLGGVYQYFLNESQDAVIGKKAIELHNPLFEFPTTGEIAGDDYYYIANTQLRRYNSDGSLFDLDKLNDVIILKTKLTD